LRSIARLFKGMLTKIGALLPLWFIHWLNATVNYLYAGHWLSQKGFSLQDGRVKDRIEVFRKIAEEFEGQRVLYLEFGVHRGDSMRIWGSLLRHPESQLHGFDSFQGLPERWLMTKDAGEFNTNGVIPEINDPRVKFHPGWFEDTLRDFIPETLDRMLLNIDADLYSSTRTVLDRLGPAIELRDIIYFDEFTTREHELRAWEEFLTKTTMEFEIFTADVTLSNIAFRRVR